MDINLEINFEFLWQSAIFLVLCLVLFLIAKFALYLFWPKVKQQEELVDKDNVAYAIHFVGYFGGVLAAILGVLSNDGEGDFWIEIAYTAMYGIGVIFALNITGIIYDKFILRNIPLKKGIIEDQNSAAGILKGANMLSSGIILYGVLLADAGHPLSVLIYWGIAQVFVMLITVFYDLITPFKVAEHIMKNNIALALAMAGLQIAFAILVQWGIQVEHTNWISTILTIGIDVAIGAMFLPIIRLIVDKIFLPTRSLTDEIVNQEKPNVGVGLIEALSYIIGAMLFVWCWNL